MTLTYPKKLVIQKATDRIKSFREAREFEARIYAVLERGSFAHHQKCTEKDRCCFHNLIATLKPTEVGYHEHETGSLLSLIQASVNETVELTEREAVHLGVLDDYSQTE